MFTLKIIRENGSEGMQCARYTVGTAGGVSTPDGRVVNALDEGSCLLEQFLVCPGGITDIYVMNDAGKTVDHIH